MSLKNNPIRELLDRDQRYTLDAYQFVREALAYAQEVLRMPAQPANLPQRPKAIT